MAASEHVPTGQTPRLQGRTLHESGPVCDTVRQCLQFCRLRGFVDSFLDKIPESFVVPRDRIKLEDAIKRNQENSSKPIQWIVKPTHSCEGKGIFFITKV